jgi:AmmeMemoRadiSam system protein A
MDGVDIPSASQTRLLCIARCTLEDLVRDRRRLAEDIDDPYLQVSAYGAFVTLHKGDELRGCVGICTPSAPLYQTVVDMTQAAASRDHRVAPVTETELNDIRIDISVLSPLEFAHDPLLLEVGRHGLHIARGKRRGVLLPQVATQQRWDIKTFLEQTCLKAGLPENAWKQPDTLVSSFSALIIEEAL